jgi:hypothetical protein
MSGAGEFGAESLGPEEHARRLREQRDKEAMGVKLHQKAMPLLWKYAQEHQVPSDQMGVDELKFLYDMSTSCGPNFTEAERDEYMKYRTDLTIGASNIKELFEKGVVEVDGLVVRLHGDFPCDTGLLADIAALAVCAANKRDWDSHRVPHLGE